MPVTEEEIRKLPRWARVAFAARCARRVVGLFAHAWPDAPEKYISAVNRAVALVEELARTGKLTRGDADADAAYAARAAARAAAYAARAARATRAAAARATRAAAARAADDDAASRAATAAEKYGGKEATEAAQEFDLRRLVELATKHAWDNKTPVPPEILGPLWPDGTPPGWPISVEDGSYRPESEVTFSIDGEPLVWPVAEDHPKLEPRRGARLDVTFDIPANVDDKNAQAAVRELYDALNELHVASGGSGLVVEDYQSFVEQFAEVLV